MPFILSFNAGTSALVINQAYQGWEQDLEGSGIGIPSYRRENRRWNPSYQSLGFKLMAISLPTGAIARFGQGKIYNINYFPDGNKIAN